MESALHFSLFFVFCIILTDGWGKIKVKLTTLPRIFIQTRRVSIQLN